MPDYQAIDFSPLCGTGVYLVDCETIEEALHFLSEMKRQYPAKTRAWVHGETHWNENGRKTLYMPNINIDDNLYWDYAEYYEETAAIIQFASLLPDATLEESDLPIEFLIGE